jgi:basic amino acid/polyamine antiporter, APA family
VIEKKTPIQFPKIRKKNHKLRKNLNSLKGNQLFRRKSLQSILTNANDGPTLRKNLRLVDLTAFGIAAIIGAGIFSTIGNAAFFGGPAVAFLFVFTAVACAFSALCYAEFASSIPISGSAYTYAYVSFGELLAWIMGWVLILEYAVGNIAVSISWSEYFVGFIAGFGIIIPDFLTIDYFICNPIPLRGIATDGIRQRFLRRCPFIFKKDIMP